MVGNKTENILGKFFPRENCLKNSLLKMKTASLKYRPMILYKYMQTIQTFISEPQRLPVQLDGPL